jgi:anti-sigma-K factor RskA
MNLGRPERAGALAAEYVLGTLRGRARQRFERVARTNRALADAVREWEERLLPLAEALPPVVPPAHIWRAVQTRIGPAPARRAPFWSSLGLWRAIAVAALAAVVVLSAVLLRPAPERPEGALVVVLAGSDAKPALVASADRLGRYLSVKAVGRLDIPADRALELWMLPQGANPRSLGLLDAAGTARVPLAAPADEALRSIPALAVSLEPRGGSPTGLPTGPVLYTGAVQRTY